MTTNDIARATFDRLAELMAAGGGYWDACEQLDRTCAPDAPRALDVVAAVAAAFIEALREHVPDRPWSLADLDELTVNAPPSSMGVGDGTRFSALAYANSLARSLELPRRDFDLDDVASARATCRVLAQVAFAAAGTLADEQDSPDEAKRVVGTALRRAAALAHLVV